MAGLTQVMKRLLLLALLFAQPAYADLGPAEYTGPLFKDRDTPRDIVNAPRVYRQLKNDHVFNPWCASRELHCKVQVLDDRIIVDDTYEVPVSRIVRFWSINGVSVMDSAVFIVYRKLDGSLGRAAFAFWKLPDALALMTRLNDVYDNHLLAPDAKE